ncbi:hypothetical protein Dvina_08490 [Dactylosporangium vinaceum]|uniref:Uncharacterized protein n=1 Tax=Dactylosporangium vinaceum TaxID=53362 RepID=A0ABV5M043_9ACTN|nr:hypothetical protein [Dactylosporangium vinaceum]UAB98114.1 hypothetical protein Dvina_08490 [Dactylosporangium vinaceum]
MGQMIRQIGPNTTRYYWYPGDKKEWLRALVAIGAGGAVLGLTYFLSRNWLISTTLGLSVAAGVAGFNFGRRDLAAADTLNARTPRRDVAGATGRAAWRGLAQGFVVAFSALVVVHLSADGFVADWLLPLAPGIAFGLAWQASLIAGRLSHESTKVTEFVGPDASRRADDDLTRRLDADSTETVAHPGPLAEATEDVRRS